MNNILNDIFENSCEIWLKAKQLNYEINLFKNIYSLSSNNEIDNWNNFSSYINDFFSYLSRGKIVITFCYFNRYNNQIWKRYVTIIDLIITFIHSKDYNIIQNYELFFEQLCEQLQFIELAFEPLNQI